MYTYYKSNEREKDDDLDQGKDASGDKKECVVRM